MEHFIARQPIFNRQRQAFAYTLLFRDDLQKTLESENETEVNTPAEDPSCLLIGIRTLTNGKRGFIELAREVLVKEHLYLFPEQLVAPEITRNMPRDPHLVVACRKLKEAGYLISLGHIKEADASDPFLELADVVKVDFAHTDEEVQRELADFFSSRGIALLADNVETYGDFAQAVYMGYRYFGGRFFATPEILRQRDVPGYKMHYMQLLQQIHRPEIDIDQLEGVIKKDMSLAYRLLRYVNSAFFGWRVEIRSIRHALVLLGEQDVRKWASLVALSCMGDDKPEELLIVGLTRARFCESVAPALGLERDAGDLFLLGMFSVLDAVMDRPFHRLLDGIPISKDVTDALLGEPCVYRDVLDLVLEYEHGHWTGFVEITGRLGLNQVVVPNSYQAAIDWAHQSLGSAVLDD